MERNTDNQDLYKIPEIIKEKKPDTNEYAVFFNDCPVSGKLSKNMAYQRLNYLKKQPIYLGVTNYLKVKIV